MSVLDIGPVIEAIHKSIGPFTDPVLGELGQHVAEKIRWLRYRQAVKTMDRARELLKEAQLSPGPVPPRLLVPILEGASLEDEDSEDLIETWAGLLASAASAPNSVPPSFPFVLRQLTGTEVRALDTLYTPGRWGGRRVIWISDIGALASASVNEEILVAEVSLSHLLNLRRLELVEEIPAGRDSIRYGGESRAIDVQKSGVVFGHTAFGADFVASCKGPAGHGAAG